MIKKKPAHTDPKEDVKIGTWKVNNSSFKTARVSFKLSLVDEVVSFEILERYI